MVAETQALDKRHEERSRSPCDGEYPGFSKLRKTQPFARKSPFGVLGHCDQYVSAHIS